MDLIEARRVLRDDSAGKFGWAAAAAVIAQSLEDGKEPSHNVAEDMLLCLSREELAASTAVAVLHRMTKRPAQKGASYRDAQEWRAFLSKHGFLKNKG